MNSFDSILEDYNTILGEFNDEAIGAVKSLLEEEKVNFSPLLIYGNVGVGKTHILKAVEAYMKANGNDERSIIYFDNRGLAEFLCASQELNEYQKMEYFDAASIIILDDVQQYAHLNRTQNYILDFISKSRELKIPIIVAGNNHPNSVSSGFNPSLLSKLSGGLAVKIDVPDVKSKIDFINGFAKTKGLTVEMKIMEKVIDYFESDFSILQGVINKLEFYSGLNGNDVVENLILNHIFQKEY